MSNEKMQILKMLEERKISADEAAKLLAAIGEERGSEQPRTYGSQERPQSSSERRPTSSVGFDDFANDLGRKFETLARDMEPKLQKFASVVAEKTSEVADRISKNVNEMNVARSAAAERSQASPTPPPKAAPAAPPTAAPTAGAQSFEVFVDGGYNELNIAGFNGDISVRGYNGNKISTKVFAKERRPGARIEFMRLGNRYYLSYDEEDFKSVSVDALVPESMFNNIRLSTTNGRMDISNLATDYFAASGSNGLSDVKNIKSDNIKIETCNGRLNIENLKGVNAQIEGSNGALEANYIDIANMQLSSANGGITVNVSDFANHSDYVWVVETSNGKVSVNVPTTPNIGYYVKAHTSLGSVRVGLVGMGFTTNDQNNAEAKSINYDSMQKRVKLSLETSNAALNIN